MSEFLKGKAFNAIGCPDLHDAAARETAYTKERGKTVDMAERKRVARQLQAAALAGDKHSIAVLADMVDDLVDKLAAYAAIIASQQQDIRLMQEVLTQ